MSRRIPQWFISELLEKVDIVDVIMSRMTLKKTGYNYSACCPFHQEKTPSFSVSQSKQFFYCFGCGAHGSALGFIMDFEHLSYPEAIEKLASSIGLTLPDTTDSDSAKQHYDKKQKYYELLQAATVVWAANLRTQAAQDAVNYLKARGLTGVIAKQFQLGFAMNQWNQLIEKLTTQGWSIAELKTVGLISHKKDSRPYDYFRNRIMFPIRNKQGKTIAFGGRVIHEGMPKYLNSPETPLFQKNETLYGLYESLNAKSSDKSWDKAVLIVEGYMDVIALQQLGYPHVVACLGTAITAKQIKQLFNYYTTLIFCFDGDQAGEKASFRALENSMMFMEEGRECRFVLLPTSYDPDALIREKGIDAFNTLVENGLVLSNYLLDYCSKQCSLDSTEGRSKLIGLVKPHLLKLPESIYKHVITQQLAKLVKMDESALQACLAIDNKKQVVKATRKEALVKIKQQPNKRRYALKQRQVVLTPILRIILLLLQDITLAQTLSDVQSKKLAQCTSPDGQLGAKILTYIQYEYNQSLGGFVEFIKQEIAEQELKYLLDLIAQASSALSVEMMQTELLDTVDKVLKENEIFENQALIKNLAEVDFSSLSAEEKKKINELYK